MATKPEVPLLENIIEGTKSETSTDCSNLINNNRWFTTISLWDWGHQIHL